MKVLRILVKVALCIALFPGHGALSGDELRLPTPAQLTLCQAEIGDVRGHYDDCQIKGDDVKIINGCSRAKVPRCGPCQVLLRCLESVSENPAPEVYGAWEEVIPEDSGSAIHGSLGMPTIHAMLLPSGKVLLAGGSGWRNPLDSDTYPQKSYPASAEGVFSRDKDKSTRDADGPFLQKNKRMYQRLVNNVAVYDPGKNTFFRIPPPPLQDVKGEDGREVVPPRFHASDLFCSGHLHLPDGNPLFMGGTQYYSPIISGVRTSYIFDWKKELKTDWRQVDWRIHPSTETPWTFAGLMERGRWYPTPVPLRDGRLVILSGLRGFDEKPGEADQPYLFEVNSLVEIFDPAKFAADDPQEAWTSISVKELPNSPFTRGLEEDAKHGICLDKADLSARGEDSPPCHPEGPAEKRADHDFKYDTFKLYPHVYNLSADEDGVDRLFFTREGDFISMRSPDMAAMRKVKKTYWMEIGGSPENPRITFELGASRTDHVPSFGTSFIDPNNGSIRVLGGGKNSPGTLFPLDTEWRKRTRFAGARGSRDLETYSPEEGSGQGRWWRKADFLGENPQDDRILSNAILLPTKQVLVINGGNQQLQKPIFNPLLMTPNEDAGEPGYQVERMSEAVEPRQYHAVALLLPDGRVWTSGGNSAPALVNKDEAAWKAWEEREKPARAQPKHDPDLVDLDVHFYREGRYARNQKGSMALPAENWTAEIFSPPYLFIDGDRRAEVTHIERADSDPGPDSVKFKVSGVDGETMIYWLKSNQSYFTTIEDAPNIKGEEDRSGSYRLIKLPSVTHAADFGQRLYELESLSDGTGFVTPDAREANIPPGYYMLFFVDAMGKPAKAKMVLFDDDPEAMDDLRRGESGADGSMGHAGS